MPHTLCRANLHNDLKIKGMLSDLCKYQRILKTTCLIPNNNDPSYRLKQSMNEAPGSAFRRVALLGFACK
jgi:hypothetical protein